MRAFQCQEDLKITNLHPDFVLKDGYRASADAKSRSDMLSEPQEYQAWGLAQLNTSR